MQQRIWENSYRSEYYSDSQIARYQSGNILGQEGLIVLTLHLILVNYCLTASHSWVSADAEQKNYKTYSNGQKEQVLACNS